MPPCPLSHYFYWPVQQAPQFLPCKMKQQHVAGGRQSGAVWAGLAALLEYGRRPRLALQCASCSPVRCLCPQTALIECSTVRAETAAGWKARCGVLAPIGRLGPSPPLPSKPTAAPAPRHPSPASSLRPAAPAATFHHRHPSLPRFWQRCSAGLGASVRMRQQKSRPQRRRQQ